MFVDYIAARNLKVLFIVSKPTHFRLTHLYITAYRLALDNV